MTDFKASDRDVSRAIRSWLHEDRHEDASRIAGAVLDRVEAAPERRAGWPAWRTPTMNRFMTFGLGAAAVVVALVVGAQLLSEPSNTGGPDAATPTQEPTATPTAIPTATPRPTPTPVAVPPLTQSFTSTQHGISMSYPEEWIVRPATEPYTDRPEPQFLHPGFDVLKDPLHDGELFLWITSRPIGEATPEEWLTAALAGWGCTATEPIAVDGATGLIGAQGCYELATVTTAGRGYEIGLYHGSTGERRPDPSYNRAWFEEVLATIRLHPEDAVD
jgi:hypothetical protein